MVKQGLNSVSRSVNHLFFKDRDRTDSNLQVTLTALAKLLLPTERESWTVNSTPGQVRAGSTGGFPTSPLRDEARALPIAEVCRGKSPQASDRASVEDSGHRV